MHRSSMIARIVTVLGALLVAPIALGLIASGGTQWFFLIASYARAISPGQLIGLTLLQVLGVLLLAGVVLSGLWSSAGLIATAAPAIMAAVFAASPPAFLWFFRTVAPRLPYESLEVVTSGLAVAVLTVTATMGVVIAQRRHRPRPTTSARTIIGAVAAPLALLLGGWLLLWSITMGSMRTLGAIQLADEPLPALALIGGMGLTVLGIWLTRLCWFALLGPAAFLLALSLIIVMPEGLMAVYTTFPQDIRTSTGMFFLLGGGVALAVIYVVFTIVQLIFVRRGRAAAAAASLVRAFPPPPPPPVLPGRPASDGWAPVG